MNDSPVADIVEHASPFSVEHTLERPIDAGTLLISLLLLPTVLAPIASWRHGYSG